MIDMIINPRGTESVVIESAYQNHITWNCHSFLRGAKGGSDPKIPSFKIKIPKIFGKSQFLHFNRPALDFLEQVEIPHYSHSSLLFIVPKLLHEH